MNRKSSFKAQANKRPYIKRPFTIGDISQVRKTLENIFPIVQRNHIRAILKITMRYQRKMLEPLLAKPYTEKDFDSIADLRKSNTAINLILNVDKKFKCIPVDINA